MVLPLLCGYAIGMSSSRYFIKRSYNIVLAGAAAATNGGRGRAIRGTHVNITRCYVLEDYLPPDCFYSFRYC